MAIIDQTRSRLRSQYYRFLYLSGDSPGCASDPLRRSFSVRCGRVVQSDLRYIVIEDKQQRVARGLSRQWSMWQRPAPSVTKYGTYSSGHGFDTRYRCGEPHRTSSSVKKYRAPLSNAEPGLCRWSSSDRPWSHRPSNLVHLKFRARLKADSHTTGYSPLQRKTELLCANGDVA